jgi:hypothetical protein
MSTISEIKETIKHLSEEEFNSFSNWFHKLEEKKWDKELEKDIEEGRLDDLAQEALKEYNDKKCTEL